MEEIGRRLKQIREYKNLTQTAFGEALGVTKQAVANAESAHSLPSIKLLYRLIEKFDVNVNWLITGNGALFISGMPEISAENKSLALKIEKIETALKSRGIL